MAFNLKAGNSGNPMHKNFASSFPTKDVKLKGKHDEKVRRSKQPKGTTYDEADDSSNAPTSPMNKITKKVGSRTDYTEREDKEVNTMSKTKDISQARADRIARRQDRQADSGKTGDYTKTKKLGTRTDYTEREDKEVNTLKKTKDISQRRADRIARKKDNKADRDARLALGAKYNK